jgi:hypothetical protein
MPQVSCDFQGENSHCVCLKLGMSSVYRMGFNPVHSIHIPLSMVMWRYYTKQFSAILIFSAFFHLSNLQDSSAITSTAVKRSNDGLETIVE